MTRHADYDLDGKEHSRGGSMGTSMRGPGAVLWTWQICDIALAILGVGLVFTQLQFMLKPLTLAYFLTFLMAPMMDLLEKRPMFCFGKELCAESAPYERTVIVWEDEEKKIPKYDANRNVVWATETSAGDDVFFQMIENPENLGQDPPDMIRMKDKYGLDVRATGGIKWTKELFLLGKIPHGIACVITLLFTMLSIVLIGMIISSSFADFAQDEKDRINDAIAAGKTPPLKMTERLKNVANEMVDQLEHEGVVIIRDRVCPKRNITDTLVQSQVKDTITIETELFEADTNGNTISTPVCKKVLGQNIRVYDAKRFRCKVVASKVRNSDCAKNNITATKCAQAVQPIDFPSFSLSSVSDDFKGLVANASAPNAVKSITDKVNQETSPVTDINVGVKMFNFVENLAVPLPNCTKIPVFGAPNPGMPWSEFLEYVSIGVTMFSDLTLIVLLAIYILLERPEGQTMSGDHRVMMEIENMIKSYIGLKTQLSFLTGVLTYILLVIWGVPLSSVFGLMAFLLNYLPMVGSMIAMFVPVPILILDENLSSTAKLLAFGGPALVQGAIGNFIEPAVFGKSLNMTAMAVLLSLVFFNALWGLTGAVLSVPLLGILKIIAHHTEHPVAKHFLALVREDAAYA